MQDLNTLIQLLTKARSIHVCVLDLSGILNTPLTDLPWEKRIHSKDFCSVAKSTAKGSRLCFYCKALANQKAIEEKRPFCGMCPWGLLEVAVPVVRNDVTVAIVYVGHFVSDPNVARMRIRRACSYTGVDEKALLTELTHCEVTDDPSEAFSMAKLVRDYLLMLSEQSQKSPSTTHWLVTSMKQYAKHASFSPLSLKELSRIYHKNEKYLGRLFKSETGQTFHEYCNGLRLKKAEKLLTHTSERVINVALECGFNNVSYFNRVFHQKHGMTPTEYRAKHA